MAFDTGYLKAHWYYFVAGIIGVFVLYEIVKNLGGGGSSGGSQDVSGGADQVQALSAAADLQNAQVNGATTVAAYQAGTNNNAIAAQLQATEVTTAAELDATNHQTEAAREVSLAQAKATVDIQQIKTNGDVQQIAIEGATLDTLGAQRAQVENNQINTVGSQISQILDNSKHASQDLTAFAPIVAEETGQGGSAGALAGANAQSRVAGSAIASTAITTGGGIVSGLLDGLFA